MGRAASLAVAVAVAILGLLPASASASPGARVAQLSVPASKGRGIVQVFSYGRMVTLRTSRGFVRSNASVSYTVAGSVTRRRISADFDRFGFVSLRFVADAPPKESPMSKRCGGGTWRLWKGSYRGTMAFHPGHGLPSVARRHLEVPGTVIVWPRTSCEADEGEPHLPGAHRADDKRTVVVGGTDCGHRGFSASGTQEVSAHTGPVPGRVSEPDFTAYDIERIGRVEVTYSAAAFAERGLLSVDGELTEATVRPPSPFHGSATLGTDPATGKSIWTGDLAVSFPGRRVSLTGPGLAPFVDTYPAYEGGYGASFVVLTTDCAVATLRAR